MYIMEIMVAGPVFLEIARKVYATSIEMHPEVSRNKDVPIDLPYTKTGNRAELRQVLKELDVPVNNNHLKSDWVNTEKKQENIDLSNHKVMEGLVPDVVSMGAKDAVYLMENAGLQVKLLGYGSVRNQSIPPGTRITKGDQIILEMSLL